MAAPTVASYGTYAAETAIPVPAGVVSGSVVVVLVCGYWDGDARAALAASPGAGFTAPSGFTAHAAYATLTPDGDTFAVTAYWKRASGAESGTYAFAEQTISGVVAMGYSFGVALRIAGGPESGTPFRSGSSGASVTSEVSVTVPAFTPAGNDSLILAMLQLEPSARTVTAYPAGWAPVTTLVGGVVGGVNTVYAEEQGTSASTGDLAWVFNEGAYSADVAVFTLMAAVPPLATPVVTIVSYTDPTTPDGPADGTVTVTCAPVSGAESYDALIAEGATPDQGDFVLVEAGVTLPYTFVDLDGGTRSYGIIARGL